MSTFWCVFWWVLLGFLLGWLCNWLLSRWLGGDDDGRGTTYKPVGTPPSSNSGESSGVNWQTQMVDRSRPVATATTGESTADKGVLGAAAGAVGAAGVTATSAVSKVVDSAADVGEAVVDGASDVAEGTVDTVADTGEAAGGGAADVAKDTTDLEGNAVDAAVDTGEAVAEDTADLASNAADTTEETTSGAVAGLAAAGAVGTTSYFANEKENTQANKSFGAIDKIADDENIKNNKTTHAAETTYEPANQPASQLGSTGSLFATAGAATGAMVFDKAAAKAAGFNVKGEDDLTVVEGIGPKINKLFNDAGIRTFAELSDTPVEKMQGILDAAGPRYRLADPTTWGQQAGLAAQNSWEELKELQDRLDGGRLV